MERSQIITAVISLVATLIALVSLHRSGKVQRQQLTLQAKQEELVGLQLQMLRKQAATSEAPAKEKADVRVDLEKVGRSHRFVISNWGRGAAKRVTFDLDVTDGRISPLIKADYDEKIPIPELAPGGRVSLVAATSFDSGTAFYGRWTWQDPDGSIPERASLLTL